jgi:hypothetical protein
MHEHGRTGWKLCLQYGVLNFKEGHRETGYRWIWRNPLNPATGKANLQTARAQARIPSFKIMRNLMAAAAAAGWGGHDADLEDGILEMEDALASPGDQK